MSGKNREHRIGDDELSDDEMEAVVSGLKTTAEQVTGKSFPRGEASASIAGDIVIESRIKR